MWLVAPLLWERSIYVYHHSPGWQISLKKINPIIFCRGGARGENADNCRLTTNDEWQISRVNNWGDLSEITWKESNGVNVVNYIWWQPQMCRPFHLLIGRSLQLCGWKIGNFFSSIIRRYDYRHAKRKSFLSRIGLLIKSSFKIMCRIEFSSFSSFKATFIITLLFPKLRVYAIYDDKRWPKVATPNYVAMMAAPTCYEEAPNCVSQHIYMHFTAMRKFSNQS